MQSDPIGLEGGENSFVYVGGNPLARVDESGKQIAVTLGKIGLELLKKAVVWTYDYGLKKAAEWGIYATAAYLIVDTVNDLNSIKNKSRTVPYPPRKKRYWTAICRVDDQSLNNDTNFYEGTNIRRTCAFGFGIDVTMTGARKKAEKMAKDVLGSSNVHHPACKCTSPNGVTGPCGR